MTDPNAVICRDYTVDLLVDSPGPFQGLLAEPSYETIRFWYRQARLRCGDCRWSGWTEPWSISSPEEPRPTQAELTERIGTLSCPRCVRAKEDGRVVSMFGMERVYEPKPPEWVGGGHYTINWIREDFTWEWIGKKFSKGEADENCWILFSTSGVHGTYMTLDKILLAEKVADEEEEEEEEFLTFLCVEPRLVRICYGNLPIRSEEDKAWLRRLAASSLKAIASSQKGNLPAESK